MMQPTLQYVRENYADRVNVVFHDVWKPDGRAPAAERRIRVIPTQIFLDANGNEFYRNEGFLPKEDVVKIIEARLSE
jgi:thioredoxin 1